MTIYYNVRGTIRRMYEAEQSVDETYSNIDHARETARLLNGGAVTLLSPLSTRQKTLVIEQVLRHGTDAFNEFCNPPDSPFVGAVVEGNVVKITD